MTIDQIKSAIADIARPFAIISTSGAAAWATVDVARRVSGGSEGALFIGAVFTGLAALYGFKAWENTRVDAAAAKAGPVAPPPGTATLVAAPDVRVEATVTEADTGELPADQRVKL